jgi:hypothetical protein
LMCGDEVIDADQLTSEDVFGADLSSLLFDNAVVLNRKSSNMWPYPEANAA